MKKFCWALLSLLFASIVLVGCAGNEEAQEKDTLTVNEEETVNRPESILVSNRNEEQEQAKEVEEDAPVAEVETTTNNAGEDAEEATTGATDVSALYSLDVYGKVKNASLDNGGTLTVIVGDYVHTPLYESDDPWKRKLEAAYVPSAWTDAILEVIGSDVKVIDLTIENTLNCRLDCSLVVREESFGVMLAYFTTDDLIDNMVLYY